MRLNVPQGIEVYTRAHYPLLVQWYAARGRVAPNTGSLSDLGFVVDGKVAGFLYTTNSNIAMIEGVIADPNTLPSSRRQSLLKLCCLLTDTAIALGYKHVIALTQHPNIEDICERLGFEQKDLKMFAFSDTSSVDEMSVDAIDN